MPELPEVESMVGYLQGCGLVGAKIYGVQAHHYRFNEIAASEGLVGATITGISRKAKYMIFRTDAGILLCHNKFTGYWEHSQKPWSFDYVEYKRPPNKMTDVRFVLDVLPSGTPHIGPRLMFHDARCLADLGFYPGITSAKSIKKLAGMGPDVMVTPTLDSEFVADSWTLDVFLKGLKRKNAIKLHLLDQTVQAGIGNIAACEALWHSEINPLKPAGQLSVLEAKALHKAVLDYMQVSIQNKLEYGKYLQVFRVKECVKCKSEVKRITQANRGTYLCPSCQK